MIFSSYIVYIEGSEVIFSKQMTLFARVPVKWFPVSEGIYSPLTITTAGAFRVKLSKSQQKNTRFNIA